MNIENKRKRQRSGNRTQLLPRQPQLHIPISLGKPSLRIRLEAYYSLIAPKVISDKAEWRSKFELIYQKYGGSVEREAALASKLAKKYGNTVMLRLTEVETTMTSRNHKETTNGMPSNNGGITQSGTNSNILLRNEEWYKLLPLEQDSGIVDFTSNKFDPVAALSLTYSQVCEVNPFIKNAQFLDNTSRFQYQLPMEDPQRKVRPKKTKNCGLPHTTTSDMRVKVPVLTALVSKFENSGPLSLLHSIHVKRQRVRVMIRYVDCIRGTLTGYLLAFDKHMNMILRDVDEVYSGRVTKVYDGMDLSKSELEYQRRKTLQKDQSNFQLDKSPMKLTKRHCPQLLVRGDNVVMVWRAESECSALHKTKYSGKSPSHDQRDRKENQVGTPGSLNLARSRQKKHFSAYPR